MLLLQCLVSLFIIVPLDLSVETGQCLVMVTDAEILIQILPDAGA